MLSFGNIRMIISYYLLPYYVRMNTLKSCILHVDDLVFCSHLFLVSYFDDTSPQYLALSCVLLLGQAENLGDR